MKFLLDRATLLAFVFLIGCARQPAPAPGMQDRYKAVHESIYRVTNEAGNRGGTGFKVKNKAGTALIITNSHVCRGAKSVGGAIYVQHENATKPQLSYILQDDPAHDLCLVDPGIDDGRPALALGEHSPGQGQYVWTQGHGALERQYPREGTSRGGEIVELQSGNIACDLPYETRREFDSWFGKVQACVARFDGISLGMNVIGGCSGSPLFDADNRVVGVIFAGRSDGGGSSAVPIEHVLKLIGF